MQAGLRAGADGRSLVVTVENDTARPITVAGPNAHVHVTLRRASDGSPVPQVFGAFADAAGPWQAVEPGSRIDLVVELRKHYAGTSGAFVVECLIPSRDAAGRNELHTARATVELSVPELRRAQRS